MSQTGEAEDGQADLNRFAIGESIFRLPSDGGPQ